MNDDHPLQFQLPSCVYNFAPTLVPGGGAEVVPPTNLEWFANNGFSFSPDNHFFAEQQQQQQQPAPTEQQYDSSSPPFNYADTDVSFPPPSSPVQPDLNLLSSLSVPSPFGLPVYSVSGFDILSILSRVHHRPNPTVQLGPVDLTCSFVVADARRYDCPIVYCSPNFCTLTGYSEQEILGRNCRFLQAPGGQVSKGDVRRFSTSDSVNLLRKSLISGKDCQTSILNYKKNGSAFINLVTVITVNGEDNEALYHVGFQVDLTEQPNAILQKLHNGSYSTNFEPRVDSFTQSNAQPGNARDRKANSIPPLVMSKDLKRLLDDSSFIHSFTATSSGTSSTEDPGIAATNHPLHLFLLEASPDFIHVVSLKGNFLYVAPSVRRVLGYESEEMMGTSLSDYAHPEDIIPLMRELKESSATGVTAPTNANEPPVTLPVMPRPVDLLFRAKTKMGRYVWVECRGRLYVEPGKGRKAIILTGRAREMMSLKWEDINLAGGLAKSSRRGNGKESTEVNREAWGTLGGTSKETATFSSVGQGVHDVLGWSSDDLLGGSLMDIVVDEDVKTMIGGCIEAMREYQQRRFLPVHRRAELDSARYMKVRSRLRKKDGSFLDAWFILYRPDSDVEDELPENYSRGGGMSIAPASLVYQIRPVDAETVVCGPDTVPPLPAPVAGGSSSEQPVQTPPSLDLFEELSIARGSSWQYELQQLRFSNARLEEELATLEAAVNAEDARKVESPPSTLNSAGTTSSSAGNLTAPTTTIEKFEAYEKPAYTDTLQRQQQNLFSRGQLAIPETFQNAHVHGNGGGVFESMGVRPFLYQPKPQYSSLQGPVVLTEHLGEGHRHGRRITHKRRQSQTQPQPQTWGTMPPPPPPPPSLLHPPYSQLSQQSQRGTAGPGLDSEPSFAAMESQNVSTGSSTLKRSRSAIDSA